MFFRTTSECLQYAKAMGLQIDPTGDLIAKPGASLPAAKVTYENYPTNRYEIAKHMVKWLGQPCSCMLWIIDFGIWPSSENMHLYYRLRQSYKDYRLLNEAPGHFFLSYEGTDLITFLQFALEAGWGGFLFGTPDYTRVFFRTMDGCLLKTTQG